MTSYRKIKEENELLKEKNEKLKLEVKFLEYKVNLKNEGLQELRYERDVAEKKLTEEKFFQYMTKIIFVIQMLGFFLSFFQKE